MKIRLENINQSFKSAYRRVKIFFRHYRGRDIFTFLFFLLLSFSFWVLLSLQEEYEIQVTIPVNYQNVPPDIAFIHPPPSKITVRMRDKGSLLLGYTFGKKIAALNIDMKKFSGQGGVLSYPGNDIEDFIMKHLSNTTNLISFNPSRIDAPYSRLVNKKLPVEFNGDIQTEPGFQISGEITIDPPVVDVYASDVVLDTLKTVSTVYTDIRKSNKTVKENIRLLVPEGVTVEPQEVNIEIPIEEYTEKKLEIPVVAKGVPVNFTIRMFPDHANVICSVPLSRFKDLSESDFSVEVSIDDFDQNISGMLPVTITRKPDWVEDITVAPGSIEFILEQHSSDD